jgi:hypothetical protein
MANREVSSPDKGGADTVTFEAFGVQVRVVLRGQVERDRILAALPPGAQPCAPGGSLATFEIASQAVDLCTLSRDGTPLGQQLPLHTALDILEREIRMLVALEAPELIFVHAGVVAYEGKALLLPGRTFAGKSTLVAALVRAGADYYSDEFAPLDAEGRVHPFAKPLSVRNENYLQVNESVSALGGRAGELPAPVGAVVFAAYRARARWHPRELSRGEATLALLDNTLPARTRPEQALQALTRVCERAVAVQGERGDARRVSPRLLALLSAN